ncbi:cell division ATP-binding protein FtsE [Nigerium massiliense]|uniref:cell division ATP-binding protein FtsE n=1 Tax=Nigerium massiliense TaxID=1522317 RepID=UPI00058F27C3|nr:cell division ATP-binding protein FtsE [Nigerium massiliense]
MITFDAVSKTYHGQTHAALTDVSVDVAKGEFVFLVGASGSGKSTFLRLILREYRPTSGHVYVAGDDVGRLPSWRVPGLRRKVGVVFQDFRLLPGKTVYQNVAFALQVIGKPSSVIKKTVPETLELVGLAGLGDRMPDELAGGEQQRVALARAFVNRPPMLLADEPTGNLDPATSVGIMKLLDRINRTGTTVIMATHDATVVDQMRRRVIELVDGVVVRDQSKGVYGS